MQQDYIPDEYMFAIFFALLFASLSWIVPAGYYLVAPADSMIGVDEVAVDTTNPQEHVLNITYHSNGDYVVEAEVLLFEKGADTEDVDVATRRWTVEGFIDSGTHTTTLDLDIEDPLPSGMYFYEIRIRFRPGYNVERESVYRTTPFTIENNTTAESSNASRGWSVDV